MTDRNRLDEIRQRHAAATRGPWRPCPQKSFIFGPNHEMIASESHHLVDGDPEPGAVEIRGAGAGLPMDANHDFIVESWADVAYLLSELAARDATIAERTRELGEARELRDELRIGRDTWKARCETARDQAAELDLERGHWKARAEAAERRVAEVERERDARPAITPGDARDRVHDHHAQTRILRALDVHGVNAPSTTEKAPSTDPTRCRICDWPLKERIEDGCTIASCSYRPDEGSPEWYRIRERQRALDATKPEPAGGDDV